MLRPVGRLVRHEGEIRTHVRANGCGAATPQPTSRETEIGGSHMSHKNSTARAVGAAIGGAAIAAAVIRRAFHRPLIPIHAASPESADFICGSSGCRKNFVGEFRLGLCDRRFRPRNCSNRHLRPRLSGSQRQQFAAGQDRLRSHRPCEGRSW